MWLEQQGSREIAPCPPVNKTHTTQPINLPTGYLLGHPYTEHSGTATTHQTTDAEIMGLCCINKMWESMTGRGMILMVLAMLAQCFSSIIDKKSRDTSLVLVVCILFVSFASLLVFATGVTVATTDTIGLDAAVLLLGCATLASIHGTVIGFGGVFPWVDDDDWLGHELLAVSIYELVAFSAVVVSNGIYQYHCPRKRRRGRLAHTVARLPPLGDDHELQGFLGQHRPEAHRAASGDGILDEPAPVQPPQDGSRAVPQLPMPLHVGDRPGWC